jgi:homoserine O-acetyltransferase
VSNLPHEVFTVEGFALECGAVLPHLRLAWSQQGRVGHGRPVLLCTAFAATPLDLAYLWAPGTALDPARHWLIHVEMLGNGRSSSPSNSAAPWAGPRFPPVSMRDNVALQARLLDHLGVGALQAVVGASMGGAQAVQWAVHDAQRAGAAVVIAGNAQTTLYGQLFLHTVASALKSDPAFAEGHYEEPPLLGLSRLSETWAPFALSPRFFSTGLHLQHADMAADDLPGFLAKWRTRYHQKDANDLLCHLDTWARHDIGRTPGCDVLAAAARRATCPMLFVPTSTDLYFHPDDVREQATLFPDARVQVIDTLSGHAAAFGRMPQDRERIDAAVSAFLEQRA